MAESVEQIRGVSIVACRPMTVDASVRGGSERFRSFDPATGQAFGPDIVAASESDVEEAARQAALAFRADAARSRAERADLLRRCADNIAALGDSLVQMACRETGLAPPRITV